MQGYERTIVWSNDRKDEMMRSVAASLASLNNVKRRRKKLVLNFRMRKDGPFEFALEAIDGRIIIIDILDDGIIQRNGGFKLGDEVLRVDGILLNGYRFHESLAILESQMNDETNDFIDICVRRVEYVNDGDLLGDAGDESSDDDDFTNGHDEVTSL